MRSCCARLPVSSTPSMILNFVNSRSSLRSEACERAVQRRVCLRSRSMRPSSVRPSRGQRTHACAPIANSESKFTWDCAGWPALPGRICRHGLIQPKEKLAIMSDVIKLPSEGFVRLRDVLRLIPVSKSTWWAGVKSGRFPRPCKLGPHTTAWRVEDIRRLIEQVGT